MIKHRWSCIVALVAAMAVNGLAQTPASAPTTRQMPAASDVLGQVPAGAMAVLVVRDVRQTTSKIDTFLADSGIAPLIKRQVPRGTLETIKMATMMGEGFNPNGGFAVAMMDPNAYDIDLVAMMSPASAPASAPAEKKLPFVIYVPGSDVESVFANYRISKAGKYSDVALRMGHVYATTSGGYVVASPIEKVLDDAVAAPRKLSADMSGQQGEVLNGSAVAVYVNMKVASPIIVKMLDTVEKKGMGTPMAPFGGKHPALGMYKDVVQQMQTLVLGAKVEPTGLVFDVALAYDPDSLYGKHMAEQHGSSSTYMDRLPNLPYFIAGGSQVVMAKEGAEAIARSLDQLFAAEPFSKVPEESRVRIKKVVVGIQSDVTGLQFVFGGAPEGVSGFACAAVLDCKDADTVKSLLSEAAEITQELIGSLAGDNEDVKTITVTYKKDAEKSDGLSVDVIEVGGPKVEENAAEMTKALGDDKPRFRVVTADKGVVVVTFGGGEAMMAAALKNSKGGGSIPTEPGTVEALKFMPPVRGVMLMYNIGNLFEVIRKMDENAMPISIKTKTPIALGVGVSGSSERVAVYIPTAIIKEVTGFFGMMGGGMMNEEQEETAQPTSTSKPADF